MRLGLQQQNVVPGHALAEQGSANTERDMWLESAAQAVIRGQPSTLGWGSS